MPIACNNMRACAMDTSNTLRRKHVDNVFRATVIASCIKNSYAALLIESINIVRKLTNDGTMADKLNESTAVN